MSKHRICILTQPLSNGYGGLLQAYALQTVLKRMGHEVWTEDRKHNASLFQRCIAFCKSIIIFCFSPVLTKLTNVYYSTPQDVAKINKHTDYFKDKYIIKTEPVYSNKKSEFKKYNFDTYVVGSDQVWRPRYSFGDGALYNYFLDFTKNMQVKRIAYAASFGVSDWEFTDEQSEICANLLQKFDAVSVRESDGVALCRQHFDVEATHVLDPTLLLPKEDYIALAEKEHEPIHKNKLFCYFLDNTEEKKEISDIIAKELKIKPFSIMPTALFYKVGAKYLDECTFAPVTSWIRAYMDAEFIVTDSFHGTVFSIIFSKPFIVIANKSRGISRFTSILKVFNLENRLIYDKTQLTSSLIAEGIDYEKVNYIKAIKQKESLNYLENALK